MYLSKLTLNTSRRALFWAARPYRVHQRLLMACPEEPRLLYRLEQAEDRNIILVQTQEEPDWEAAFADFPVLAAPPLCKTWEFQPQTGQLLAFRLRANPTARKRLADGSKKRVGLKDEEEQMAWLARKGQDAGFRLLHADARQEQAAVDDKVAEGRPHHMQWLAVQFDGLLQVTDSQRLHAALSAGIGSGKGFGFGLLSLAPAR